MRSRAARFIAPMWSRRQPPRRGDAVPSCSVHSAHVVAPPATSASYCSLLIGRAVYSVLPGAPGTAQPSKATPARLGRQPAPTAGPSWKGNKPEGQPADRSNGGKSCWWHSPSVVDELPNDIPRQAHAGAGHQRSQIEFTEVHFSAPSGLALLSSAASAWRQGESACCVISTPPTATVAPANRERPQNAAPATPAVAAPTTGATTAQPPAAIMPPNRVTATPTVAISKRS